MHHVPVANDVVLSFQLHLYFGADEAATTPDRTITPDVGTAMTTGTFGIAVDATARNLLYVGMFFNGSTSIFVYRNASTASTTTTPLAPDRT